MGGDDDKNNLVRLSPEEHYVAHQLLHRMYPHHKGLLLAVSMMSYGRSNNKLYGWIRRKLAKVMSEGQEGDKNSQYGTIWITNSNRSIESKISRDKEIPEGWVMGRKDRSEAKVCSHCEELLVTKNQSKYCSERCRSFGMSGVNCSSFRGRVSTDFGSFSSVKEAAGQGKLTERQIRHRIDSQAYPDFFWESSTTCAK